MKALLLMLITLPSLAFATAQTPDVIDLDGKEYYLFSTPLESYFTKRNPRPEWLTMTSTASWRGYRASWKIIDERLYLTRLIREGLVQKGNEWEETQTDIWKRLISEKASPLFASWFSGVLRLPQGKEVRYVHMGFGSIYERDLYLTIKAGKVVKRHVVDNRGAGATRSSADLAWVALGEAPVESKEPWLDARSIMDARLQPPFRTRGIYFAANDGDAASLDIPETPTTEPISFSLFDVPTNPKVPAGSHVEVVVVKRDIGSRSLNVKSIRMLEPGESIHHPDFKAPPRELAPQN